ncbi:hypothetical protein [Edaphobacter sp.]|uniref:hypothetical protein n=1 Tax=Edaphobacter sp. TaxID=1934404 RepID=UPI002DB7ED61|nr:hypothetical protein [Edaphobacter sp.]HEU5341568.1 hypothetical protein [Edaphobacter sp.]
MHRRLNPLFRVASTACLMPCLISAMPARGEGPTTAAVAAFNAYSHAVESRLTEQHRSPDSFLALSNQEQESARLRAGEFVIEQITPPQGADLPGAMLHHWRGTAFAPGATATDFVRLMQDYNSYPKIFSPQVLEARALTPPGGHMQAWMRVRQKHVITVVMDTSYDVTFGQLDRQHGYSISHSTRIDEIDSPGTARERVLTSSQEHGFLWRLDTYWSYEERDGGLYLQIETISLTRSIPPGLGWVIGPYVESVPRESLEFTLHAACNTLKNPAQNTSFRKASSR